MPQDDPKLLIYVVVDRPNTIDQAHSTYAQNLCREILEEALPYLNIYADERLDEKSLTSDLTNFLTGLSWFSDNALNATEHYSEENRIFIKDDAVEDGESDETITLPDSQGSSTGTGTSNDTGTTTGTGTAPDTGTSTGTETTDAGSSSGTGTNSDSGTTTDTGTTDTDSPSDTGTTDTDSTTIMLPDPTETDDGEDGTDEDGEDSAEETDTDSEAVEGVPDFEPEPGEETDDITG